MNIGRMEGMKYKNVYDIFYSRRRREDEEECVKGATG